jgi:hypothetical protein
MGGFSRFGWLPITGCGATRNKYRLISHSGPVCRPVNEQAEEMVMAKGSQTSDADIAAFLTRGGKVTHVASDARAMTEREIYLGRRGEYVPPMSDDQREETMRQDAFEAQWRRDNGMGD